MLECFLQGRRFQGKESFTAQGRMGTMRYRFSSSRDRVPSLPRLVLLLALLAGLPLLASCVGKPRDSQVQAVVNSPDGVEQVRQIETKLAVTPASVEGKDGYQVLGGVAVERLPEYRLGPGDVLEIVYHIHYEKDPSSYKFEVQDKINVVFPFQPQFSSTVVIRTDGRVSLPLVGEVMAESLTPDQLTAQLVRLYAKFIVNPSITVSLQEFNVKIDELKKAITTAPRGQSKIAPITPDGQVSLPIIGTMQAAGFTVRELEKMINERYGSYVRNLQTTLIVNEIHHMKFYVLGEVAQPGAFEMAERPTLLQALAKAGGYKTGACLSDVVVIRTEGLEKPMVFKVDLEKSLNAGTMYAGLPVQPADIIYVPKTAMQSADDVIEQVFTKGLYGVMPFASTFTVNYDLTKYYQIR